MINKRFKTPSLFSTPELSLTAALITWGFSLNYLDRSNPNKIVFQFLKNSELESAVETFWDNTGKVSPKAYFYALREVKSRIYGGQQ